MYTGPAFEYKSLTKELLEETIKKVFSTPKPSNRAWSMYCGSDTYMAFEVSTFMYLCGIKYRFHVEKRAKYRYHIDLFQKSGLYKMTVEVDGIVRVYKGTQVIYCSNTAHKGLGKFLKDIENG